MQNDLTGPKCLGENGGPKCLGKMVKIFVLGSVLRERGHGLQCNFFWGDFGELSSSI